MPSMDDSRSSDEDDTLVISEQEDGEIIFKPQPRRVMQDNAHQDKMEHRRATAAPTSEESTVLKQEEVSHRAEQHRRLDKASTLIGTLGDGDDWSSYKSKHGLDLH